MTGFIVISLEQLASESVIVLEISKITSILRKTSVGEFVKSHTFDLHFSNSIGQSKWVVILFLNGQYDRNGKPDKRICVYLQMISCERDAIEIKLDVKFQLGEKRFCKQDQLFCFKDVKKRWIGATIDEIIKNGFPDTLLLSVYLTCSTENSSNIFSTGGIHNFMIVCTFHKHT